MKFNLKNKGGNIIALGREIGYIFQREASENKSSLVRPFGRSGYPRFHLYLEIGEELTFNLHLDQKKPIYSTAHDHAAEYDGKLVENEAERIKQILG
ncbi:hypothetical protein KKA24_03595 [Patescibacteria group bacterium]|nr:hypothetical protein [Patescibacteria group bacterium]